MKFDAKIIKKHADNFDKEIFKEKILDFVKLNLKN
jgi:hypothetical protein